jgi:protein-arginine kinase
MKEEFPFYQLVIAVQRANIQMQIGRGCGNLQRDKYRAEYIRQNLPELAG